MKTSPVSARLDGLVKGWVQRTYLKADEGFWADEVLREFAFLEERGLRLEEPFFHQNGSGLTYRSDDLAVRFEYAPEYREPYLDASIGVKGRWGDRFRSVDDWLVEVDPSTVLPTRPARDRDAVSANVRFWADGLRRLLDGPEGLPR